jgi:hypothetical protein
LEELQLAIRSTDGGLLGDAEEMLAALDGLFPGITWQWTSTGADRLAAADAAGLVLPPAVRRVIESQPSVLCGEVQTGGVKAEFNLGPGGPVPAVWATLSGDGPVVEVALSRLRSRPGWSVGPGEGWLIPNAEPNADSQS